MIKITAFNIRSLAAFLLLAYVILILVHCIGDDPTAPLTDMEAVSNAIDTLSITYAEGETPTNVTTNISLPNLADHDVMVSWTSSNTNFIATNGMVTRPLFSQPNAQVTLTATLYKGMVTNTKNFILTVIAAPISDTQAVQMARSDLQIDLRNQNANGITNDIGLSNLGSHDVMVSWRSSDTNFITTNGMVTRPSFDQPNAQVVLIAILFKDEGTNTKNFPLTVLATEPPTDRQVVEQAKNGLSITYAAGDNHNRVTSKFTLPLETNGVSISWVSSSPAVISTNGEVVSTRREERVTLTATLTKNGASTTKDFMLTVPPDPDRLSVFNASNALMIVYAAGDRQNSVTKNVSLSTGGADGVSISWVSSSPAVISTNGEVVSTHREERVTLTATLTKNGASTTKDFMLTVPPDLDRLSVFNASNALMIVYAAGDRQNSVTKNVSLPTGGANEVSISWVSSDTNVISPSGVVTRPSSLERIEVILTATLRKNDAMAKKMFVVTVVRNRECSTAEFVAKLTANPPSLAGCSAQSIRNADLAALINMGVTHAQLIAVWDLDGERGFTIAQLTNAGISLVEMRTASISISNLRAVGIPDYQVFNELCNPPRAVTNSNSTGWITLITTNLTATDSNIILESKYNSVYTGQRIELLNVLTSSNTLASVGSLAVLRELSTTLEGITYQSVADGADGRVARITIPLRTVFSNLTVIMYNASAITVPELNLPSMRIELCP